MAKQSTLLKYISEKDYLSSDYENVLSRICGEEGKFFEADSREDFCLGHVIGKEHVKFPTWIESEESENISSYFRDIAQWVERSSKESTSEDSGREQLEQWLSVKSCKINDCNTYIMAPCHPMVRLIDQNSQKLCDRFNLLVEENNEVEWKIKKAVLQDYLQINENFYVYGTGQVYFSIRKNECRQAIPWADVGTLTSISSTRLIEKTKSWVIRNCDGEISAPEVGIAYIGIVNEEQVITEYYRKTPIVLQNGKKVHPEVRLTQLKQVPQREKYIFERQDNIEGSKKIYNFSSLSDMKELFRNFQIVLFLDESYFYKQRQSAKSLLEKGAADYVMWCQKELENEPELKFSDEDRESRRSYYYEQIYNRAGLWLNGYGKDDTSKLGFDSTLFSMITQAINPGCDVYLYISRGKTIGDIKLPVQSICNDERYDGKRLLVYRATEKGSAVGDENVSKSIVKMMEDSTIIASIDLWKLVKSIGKEFRAELFNDWSGDSIAICEQISLLKKVVLHVAAKESGLVKPRLQFYLQCEELESERKHLLKSFVESYLKICKEEEEFIYVKNYLYNLLVAAIIARAKSVKGIFYAHLMKKRAFVDLETIVKEEIVLPKQESDISMFRARRTIYSAIQGLDQIIIRDMEKRFSILKYEFRYKYCPDINEDTFLALLDKINEYCRKVGLVDSPLYLLTKKEEEEI